MLVVDAYVLALPEDPDAVGEYAERLLDLRALAEDGCYEVAATADAAEVLWAVSRYPDWGSLQASGVVSMPDVVAVVDSILRGPLLEDVLGIADVALEGARCVPDAHVRTRPPEFVAHHHRVLCLHRLRAEAEPTHASAVLTSVAPPLPAGVTVMVEGTVLVGQAPGGGQPSLRQYAGDARLIRDPARGRLAVDPVGLWRDGCHPLAVDTAVVARLARGTRPPAAANDWRFGDEFLATAAALGFDREAAKISRLLDACADALLGERQAQTHALRTSAGGNAPRRVRARDGAGAMRRDVDREYHLHYWDRPGRGPEFAAVVAHNDFAIPG